MKKTQKKKLKQRQVTSVTPEAAEEELAEKRVGGFREALASSNIAFLDLSEAWMLCCQEPVQINPAFILGGDTFVTFVFA